MRVREEHYPAIGAGDSFSKAVFQSLAEAHGLSYPRGFENLIRMHLKILQEDPESSTTE
jgi:hypothetical protein